MRILKLSILLAALLGPVGPVLLSTPTGAVGAQGPWPAERHRLQQRDCRGSGISRAGGCDNCGGGSIATAFYSPSRAYNELRRLEG
jgi:hypothetical protein